MSHLSSHRFPGLALLVAAAGVAASVALPAAGDFSPQARASASPVWFDPARFLEHVRALSSDEFEGRAPGSPGEEKTVTYLAAQFRAMGAAPAMPDGTYFQAVPLVGSTPSPSPLTVRRGVEEQVFRAKDDFVIWTKRAVGQVALRSSEMVFVGYGVEAPEAGWDDYKGLDAAGKTLVMLIGDPPVPDPADPAKLDPKTFGGRALTYYGRWNYKFEVAAAKRAAGVLVIHEEAPAGYAFSIVEGKLGEQFEVRTADRNTRRAAIEGWLRLEAGKRLLGFGGQDLEALKRAAATRAFQPVPLGVTASMTLDNSMREIGSRNVVARVRGTDPALWDECVVMVAHWDHFGHGPAIEGQTIRHGAVDNATGVAGLLELARAFAARPARRTMVFVAVTAEEQYLLGSSHYARNPVIPLDRTLAALNLEMLNVYGRTSDVTVYGLGASDLDDYVRAAAGEQGREVAPDPEPEQGWFYRSDHFPFARLGVPAMWVGGGDRYIGRPADYGRAKRADYIARRYHKPADTVQPDWDLSGAMEDLRIYHEVASRVASADRYPEWKPGAEFKAVRDRMRR
ncbi:MAG TPA: M28 family peptidase [Vicinamibacterales bacterium]|nr:M28 family peptidase [Vicinamibacterales bacterium]